MNIFLPEELEKTRAMYQTAVIRETARTRAVRAAERLKQQAPVYMQASLITGVPWGMHAVIQSMEASGDITRHPANGDSLESRTVRHPEGLPKRGTPPFEYLQVVEEESREIKRPRSGVWSVEWLLAAAERFNGLGYRKRGVPSPYVWAATNHERPGRYVADHVFDPEAWSKQIGVAALVISLYDLGMDPLRAM